MEVEILLSCGDILIVPVESVLLIPKVGTEIVCSKCKNKEKVIKVGIPYHVEKIKLPDNENQSSMFGGN